MFSRLIWYKEKTSKQVPKGVSVIIAAHNEKFNLKNLLPHLLKQKYPDFEIVVVNDRSNDGTLEYLREEFGNSEILRIISIVESDPIYNPKKHALNIGIGLAEKEILLLTDADCLPLSENWIAEMAGKIGGKKEVVTGYSPYVAKQGLLNKIIRYETFYTAIQYFSMTLAGNPYMGVGRNLGYTKRIFQAERGFAGFEHLTGGDDDLFVQKVASSGNTTICISSESFVYSLPKNTYKEWFLQKKRHLSVGKYYSPKVKFLLGLLVLSHIFFYISFFWLLFHPLFVNFAIIGWIIRCFVLILIFSLISRKLKEKFALISLPLLDFLYILNYIITGISTIVSTKVKWK